MSVRAFLPIEYARYLLYLLFRLRRGDDYLVVKRAPFLSGVELPPALNSEIPLPR